jgi:hypothetical protein
MSYKKLSKEGEEMQQGKVLHQSQVFGKGKDPSW